MSDQTSAQHERHRGKPAIKTFLQYLILRIKTLLKLVIIFCFTKDIYVILMFYFFIFFYYSLDLITLNVYTRCLLTIQNKKLAAVVFFVQFISDYILIKKNSQSQHGFRQVVPPSSQSSSNWVFKMAATSCSNLWLEQEVDRCSSVLLKSYNVLSPCFLMLTT